MTTPQPRTTERASEPPVMLLLISALCHRPALFTHSLTITVEYKVNCVLSDKDIDHDGMTLTGYLITSIP